MICDRCKAVLGYEEGTFIIENGKQRCVCGQCREEIRQANIKSQLASRPEMDGELERYKFAIESIYEVVKDDYLSAIKDYCEDAMGIETTAIERQQ